MNAIDFAARIAGVSRETIDAIEKAAPHVATLLKLFKDNESLICKIEAVAIEAQPLIAQIMPLINPIMAEIDAIMPAAQDVVAFIQNQKQSTQPLQPGINSES